MIGWIEIVDGREARTIIPDSPALREHMARALAELIREQNAKEATRDDRSDP